MSKTLPVDDNPEQLYIIRVEYALLIWTATPDYDEAKGYANRLDGTILTYKLT